MASQGRMEVSYRRPLVPDLGRLAEIYNYAVRETAATFDIDEKTPDQFRSFIPGDSLNRMLVTEVNGELVAYAGTYPFSQRKAYSQLAELMIYVHPAWQRRGIGSSLLREIHKSDFFNGLHTVLVLINKDNVYLHRVFEKIGYSYKGEMTEVALKFGRRHSLVIYQKETSKPQVLPEIKRTSCISIKQLLKTYRPDSSFFYDLYRTIHQDPELGLQEQETASRVAGCLRRLAGVQVKPAIGGHGLVGILDNGMGPKVLLRAELDALPVMEQTGWDFASVKRMIDLTDGITKPVMHACGHDLHMVALLHAIETLYTCREHWKGTLIALFQPNEETGRGAQEMVDDGLYDRMKHDVPHPDFVLGGHSMPMRAGRVSTRIGVFNSAADGLRVTLYGRGGHSARPHTTVDPVVLASSVVMKLQTIVNRQINPLDSAVVTVGSVQAGQTGNVIGDQAVLQISTRALSENSRSRVFSSINQMIRAECIAMESPQEPLFETTSSFPLLENDPDLTKDISKAFRDHFGGAFDSDAAISMGAEDMANLAQPVHAPCCFWTFGCIDPVVWDVAEARGTLSKDIHGKFNRRLEVLIKLTLCFLYQGNHSALFAPVLEPSLTIASDCYSVAALACLDLQPP
jgi:amidohydrolase